MDKFIKSIQNTVKILRMRNQKFVIPNKDHRSTLLTTLTSSASEWLDYFLKRTVFPFSKTYYSDDETFKDDKLFPNEDKDIKHFILLNKDSRTSTYPDLRVSINNPKGMVIFEIGNTFSILHSIYSSSSDYDFRVPDEIREKIADIADKEVGDFKAFVEKLKYDVYNISSVLYQNIITPYPFIIIKNNKVYTEIKEEWLK